MRSSIICGLVLGDRVLERDVARREPHVLVPGFLVPARLVARVRLEQPAVEVLDRGARDALVEEPLPVGDVRRGGSSPRSPRRCRCG